MAKKGLETAGGAAAVDERKPAHLRFVGKVTHPRFWKRLAWSLFRWVIFSGLIYVLITPLLFIVSTSFMEYKDMMDPTTIYIPKNPTLGNYELAFDTLGYFVAFRNSFFLSLILTAVQLFTCSLVGYGLARYRFKEKGVIFGVIIMTLIIPIQTIIVPLYMFFKNFDLFGTLRIFFPEGIKMLDSQWPMILPSIFGLGLKGGLFIYIFRQFYRGLPTELEDSAYIDGCGPFATYFRVMIPNAKPAIVTVTLFSFVWHWNDYFEPNIWLTDPDSYTLAQKLLILRTQIIAKVGGTVHAGLAADPSMYLPYLNAGIFMVMIPMLVFFIIGQKFFVENVERSGIVG